METTLRMQELKSLIESHEETAAQHAEYCMLLNNSPLTQAQKAELLEMIEPAQTEVM